MIAVAIMGIIMTLVWSSTSQSLRAKERIEKRDMVYHAGGVALRKMAEDVSMAFLARQPSASATPPVAGQPAAAAGQAAAAPGMKTFFVGEDNAGADEVRFTSLSHLRLFKDAKESDQCKVAYGLQPNPEGGEQQVLARREEVWLDATSEVKGEPLVLVEDVKTFDVEYYDLRKGEWVKTWDTEKQDWQGRLPFAVRVSLVFANPNDEEQTIPMSTAVTLPLSRGPIEF